MTLPRTRSKLAATAAPVAIAAALLCTAPAFAQNAQPAPKQTTPAAGRDMHSKSIAPQPNTNATAAKSSAKDDSAQNLLDEAVNVVNDMKKDPKVVELLEKAKGVYIVPSFGRGAVIVGARGGAGLVTVKQADGWSDPAFYDFGAISFGPQVGGAGGSVAFILMNQTAVDAFKSGNKISLNAGAGLSIVNYSADSQASWGKGDVVMWSDAPGAYVGATVSVTDINWDDDRNQDFYGKKTDMTQILQGEVSNRAGQQLDSTLPM